MVCNCESCMYYDYDEEYDEYCCQIDMDQDEMEKVQSAYPYQCPYYRFYNEYISVRRQN